MFPIFIYLFIYRVRAQSSVQDRSMLGLITNLKYDHYPAIWLRDNTPTIMKFFDILYYHYYHHYYYYHANRYILHSTSYLTLYIHTVTEAIN